MRRSWRTISSWCRRWSSRTRARRSFRPARAKRGLAAEARAASPDDDMTELTELTIAEARDGLRAKRFSAAELAEAYVAALEAARSLNAYVLETPERAVDMARAAEARLGSDDARPLEGI